VLPKKRAKGGPSPVKRAVNAIRPYITNTYDASSAPSFDEAYRQARSSGNKTFV